MENNKEAVTYKAHIKEHLTVFQCREDNASLEALQAAVETIVLDEDEELQYPVTRVYIHDISLWKIVDSNGVEYPPVTAESMAQWKTFEELEAIRQE